MLKMRELQMGNEEDGKLKEKKGSSNHSHMPPPLDGKKVCFGCNFFRLYFACYRKSSRNIDN
jgi:hypothetical protein